MLTRVQDSSAIKMPSLTNPSRSRTRKSIFASFVPSATSLVLLVSFIISLLMNGGFPPLSKRGFFCSDTSIRYPVLQDTVSFKVLLILALVVPSIVIRHLDKKLSKLLLNGRQERLRKDSNHLLEDSEEVEGLMQPSCGTKRRMVINDDGASDLEEVKRESLDCDNSCDQSDVEILPRLSAEKSIIGNGTNSETGSNVEVATVIRQRARNPREGSSDLQLFLVGFIATSFITGVAKTTSGRLRPHFIERCRPNIDCASPTNMNRYIMDFKCTGDSMRPRDYSYITTSFPSGHASIMFFSMFYLIFYLNLVIPAIANHKSSRRYFSQDHYPLLSYGVYVLMICLAIYVSLTRVSDYHHHPTDVLTGALLGTGIAVVMFWYILSPKYISLTRTSTIR